MKTSFSFEGVAYALYVRYSRIWRSPTFIFGLGSLLRIPNVGKTRVPHPAEFTSARVLIIRPDALGDVILTIPFLKSLKKSLPGAIVTLAVARPWKKFIEQLKVVDEVIEYPLDSDRWRAASNVFRACVFGFNILKKRKFDFVLCPRWDADLHDSHLVAFFSYARQRITFFEKATPWKIESNRGRDGFYTHVLSDTESRHEADRSLYFLEALGIDSAINQRENSPFPIARAITPAQLKLDPSWAGLPLIGIFPGVQDTHRQWAVAHFITAAKKILEKQQARFLAFGTENEANHCEVFCRELAGLALNCSGKTDLMALTGAIRECAVVISCNSGGAHLAGIVDIPVVVIFMYPFGADPNSPLAPERFRPLGEKVLVLQPRLNEAGTCREELHSVTADEVAKAALTLVHAKA